MQILLIGTYEGGHQPLHVATAAAGLRAAGHAVTTSDLAAGAVDPSLIGTTGAIAIAVPMHTAMRLALPLARSIRSDRPGVPICLFGLYAAVESEAAVVADRLIAGEYVEPLVEWADALSEESDAFEQITVTTARGATPQPDRAGLPPLDRYARVVIDGEERLVGYVEATRGCVHMCRHCPIPVVYGGRIRIVPVETVIADIERLVAAGAQHITFGDPDFLNGPHHAMRVIDEMHSRFPDLTYDVTTKVEHILAHREIWPTMAATGLQFVISAFETTNDHILTLLDKGHTADDMADAVHLLRAAGIEIRPSWLPFTPWTTVNDLVDILDFITLHDLFDNTDPVQLSIRLLIPDGSLMLQVPGIDEFLGDYDPVSLGYEWKPADPETDDLQRTLADLAEAGADAGADDLEVLREMWRAIADASGSAVGAIPSGATTGRPRSTESWFC